MSFGRRGRRLSVPPTGSPETPTVRSKGGRQSSIGASWDMRCRSCDLARIARTIRCCLRSPLEASYSFFNELDQGATYFPSNLKELCGRVMYRERRLQSGAHVYISTSNPAIEERTCSYFLQELKPHLFNTSNIRLFHLNPSSNNLLPFPPHLTSLTHRNLQDTYIQYTHPAPTSSCQDQ